jgi:hypothetical protein
MTSGGRSTSAPEWSSLVTICTVPAGEQHLAALLEGLASAWCGLQVFFGSDEGGKTAAVLRSFVASCQRNKLDPFLWFKDVLSRIAAHPIHRLAELLPHNWAPAQA